MNWLNFRMPMGAVTLRVQPRAAQAIPGGPALPRCFGIPPPMSRSVQTMSRSTQTMSQKWRPERPPGSQKWDMVGKDRSGHPRPPMSPSGQTMSQKWRLRRPPGNQKWDMARAKRTRHHTRARTPTTRPHHALRPRTLKRGTGASNGCCNSVAVSTANVTQSRSRPRTRLSRGRDRGAAAGRCAWPSDRRRRGAGR